MTTESPVTVEALRFETGPICVGLTKNLPRRLEEHRRRQSPTLKRFQGDFTVIYQKSFPDYRTARIQSLCNEHGEALLVSEYLYRALPPSPDFAFVLIGKTQLRGRHELLDVYAVRRCSPEASAVERGRPVPAA